MPRVAKKEPVKHDKDKIIFCRDCKKLIPVYREWMLL